MPHAVHAGTQFRPNLGSRARRMPTPYGNPQVPLGVFLLILILSIIHQHPHPQPHHPCLIQGNNMLVFHYQNVFPSYFLILLFPIAVL